MGFSRELSLSLTRYIASKKIRGTKRFPLVLMLEPSFKCNLSCSGCGRIREYRDILDQSMSLEECLAAVEEAGAPIVSITGGEPLIHPQIEQIVAGITARHKFVNLCTNGLLLKESLRKFKSSPYLSFVLHLDNLAESHDRFTGRQGVFSCAIDAMKAARAARFSVLVNTTIYKTTKMDEITKLFNLLNEVPVSGIMMAPAFSYEAVDNDVFLSRKEAVSKFKALDSLRSRYPFYNTPVYLDFLSGKRRLKCMPWSTPTRNPKGWKRPCYLLTDDHAGTFKELFEDTDWSKYGVDNNPRCANCMVHSGFEGSALDRSMHEPAAFWQIMAWSLFRR
jgi:hopanoid biosynthesis associated radical SAM protein HpnH